MKPPSPITKVEVLNPFNDQEFLSDKRTVVDIKAEDALGVKYQIEAQTANPTYLNNRMIYNWAQIYKKQIGESDKFFKLQPVIAIWLLTKNLYPQQNNCHWHFQLWDLEHQQRLTDHCSIHIIELAKWKTPRIYPSCFEMQNSESLSDSNSRRNDAGRAIPFQIIATTNWDCSGASSMGLKILLTHQQSLLA